jgi:lipoate-protein ligase A
MRRLHLTLPTPAENIALDEALLDWAEEANEELEFLRVWESPAPIVVVGRSTRVEQEVDRRACAARGIPIVRRPSGGAAIVAGPGCLMYAVVLSYKLRPELRDIGRAHKHVLGRLADALRACGLTVAHAGTSDLVIGQGARSEERGARRTSILLGPGSSVAAGRKFSGNSLRAKRRGLLYHGTLLYDLDLSLVEQCLGMPPRMPGYRAGRRHRDFVANVPISRESLAAAVDAAWPTECAVRDWPRQRVAELVAERFGRDEWNLKFGECGG